MFTPDYSILRKEAGFSWYVSSAYLAFIEAVGIGLHEFFTKPEAGIEAYKRGRPIVREMFGPDVRIPSPATPPVSYGHINGLGVPLRFPDNGEVNYERTGKSLRQVMTMLEQRPNYAEAGDAPFFLEYRRKMQEAFPEEPVGFSWGLEGPMTTAYELLDNDAFTAPYDEPELFGEFLDRLVASLVHFMEFRARFNDAPFPNPDGGGIADDIASFYAPEMWPRYVIPAIDGYYRGQTTGRRSAHIEDLRPEQVHFLEDLQITYYDPSISPKVNPEILAARCRVPFGWRLGSFHYRDMSETDVQDFVYKAAADGASRVFTIVSATMVNETGVRKVQAFMEAGRRVEEILNDGGTRADVGELVSARGREILWRNWAGAR